MAMCKPDLVAAVLRQLGHEVPDPERLTKAVFAAAAHLRREHGLPENDCTMLTTVNAAMYRGGIRDRTKKKVQFKV